MASTEINLLKINNSYESSSGSGTSTLSEPNDYFGNDDENINLPQMLQPTECLDNKDHCEEVAISTALENNLLTKTKVDSYKVIQHNDKSVVPLLQSLETSFATGKKEKFINNHIDDHAKDVLVNFYDTIVQENSSNAVDLPVSNDLRVTGLTNQFAEISNRSLENVPVLSFDGQIKSLKTETNRTKEISEKSVIIKLNDTVNIPALNISLSLQKYTNEKSPDIFADDDSNSNDDSDVQHQNSSLAGSPQTARTLGYRENCRRENEMLRKIRTCLAGVPPPPSMTIPQMELISEVLNRKQAIIEYLDDVAKMKQNDENKCASLLKPTHTLPEINAMRWEEMRSVHHLGLCYNLSTASENKELLALSIIDRFVGSETTSSYRKSPTSVKKKMMRMRLLAGQQSPGNRLSHLAKRRAIFSSANLATTSNKIFGPQLVLEKKSSSRHRRKATPRRKTPGSKKKNRKTPSSSARKRLFHCPLPKAGPSRETSKRALFQSPVKEAAASKRETAISMINATKQHNVMDRIERSKRALFSPDNNNVQQKSSYSSTIEFPLSNTNQAVSLFKRKHVHEDDAIHSSDSSQSNKFFRGASNDCLLTPRSLGIKSRSFCMGAGSQNSSSCLSMTTTATDMLTTGAAFMSAQSQVAQMRGGVSELCLLSSNSNVVSEGRSKLQRAQSEMAAPPNSLSENQRKKLLWAVSQALQERKITAKHENFKEYASVLARVVRRIFQEYHQKSNTSNSETMLRLSKKYAYNVITGRSTDDIYYQAKAQILDEMKRQSCTRLSGYIAPETYKQLKRTISDIGGTDSGMLPCTITGPMDSNKSMSLQNLMMSRQSSIDSFTARISQKSIASTDRSEGKSFHDTSFEIGSSISSLPNTNFSQSALNLVEQIPNILANSSLHNSSSKSNIEGIVLRENVDCEQRRSSQKNFTGKDQRNLSPYVSANSSATHLPRTASGFDLNVSASAKVKRHILFDC